MPDSSAARLDAVFFAALLDGLAEQGDAESCLAAWDIMAPLGIHPIVASETKQRLKMTANLV